MLIFMCLGYHETIVPNHLLFSQHLKFNNSTLLRHQKQLPRLTLSSPLPAAFSPESRNISKAKHGKPWLGFSSKQDKVEDLNLLGAETFCSAPDTAQFQLALFPSTVTTEWIDNTSTITKLKKSVHYGPYLTMPSLPFLFLFFLNNMCRCEHGYISEICYLSVV